MINLIRTDSTDADFGELVKLLDAELLEMYGEQQNFYNQFNKTNTLKNVVLAYVCDTPVGCGAIRQFNEGETEVKRMFVKKDYRGRGIAAMILKALEGWATELGFSHCILETGSLQQNAVALYTKAGYHLIPNYGQYVQDERSICMKKAI